MSTTDQPEPATTPPSDTATPRTDRNVQPREGWLPTTPLVPATFARTLERELSAALAESSRLAARLDSVLAIATTDEKSLLAAYAERDEAKGVYERLRSAVNGTLPHDLEYADATAKENSRLARELKAAEASAYAWEACVRTRENPENKSPCGHHMNHAYSPDGKGIVIRCHICEKEKALAELATARADYEHMKSDRNRLFAELESVKKERDKLEALVGTLDKKIADTTRHLNEETATADKFAAEADALDVTLKATRAEVATLKEDKDILDWLEANPDKVEHCTWTNFNLGRLWNFVVGITLGECFKTLREAVRAARALTERDSQPKAP